MEDPEDWGLAPLPGDTHTVPTENLTIEEAKAELDKFLTSPEMASLMESFKMEPRAFEEPRSDAVNAAWAKAKLEQAQYRKKTAAAAAKEADEEIGETLEFSPTPQELLMPIRQLLTQLSSALDKAEAFLDPGVFVGQDDSL